MMVEMQSRGLYSTWMYLSEINTLFDCGEGLASHLKNRAFSIQRIFFTHDHTDHISGLDTFINVRNLGGGNQDTPLEIYHPKDVPNLSAFREYIQKTQKNLRFRITWKALEPNQEIYLPRQKNTQNPRKIRAFSVEHGWAKAFGFSVIEERRRIKERYRHLGEMELTRMKRDAVKIEETYEKKLLVYSGDAWKIPLEEAKGADYIYHDCTFLNPADRERPEEKGAEEVREKTKEKPVPTHAHIEEALAFLQAAQPGKQAFLHHLSPRYGPEDVETAQKRLPANIQIIPPGKITRINPHLKKEEIPLPRKGNHRPVKQDRTTELEP